MAIFHRFDAKYTALIRGLPASYKPVMHRLSIIGEPVVVIAIGAAGFLSALQYSHKRVERAFIYALIAYGLNTVIKLLLHRPRPRGLVVETLGIRSYSLPSGHAFGTVIFYGLFAYLDIKYLMRPWNIVVAATITGLIFLIGVSRVYLGAHYPSDVIAGWLLGGVSLLIVCELAF